MTTWALAHPWLTFFIVLIALQVVYAVGAEFARALGRRRDKL
jgi:hypothetical protein